VADMALAAPRRPRTIVMPQQRSEPQLVDDADLVAAMAAGDRDALRVLYDRHAPWLVLRLRRRCADPAVVEEAVQDTFLAAWRQAERFRGTGEVGAWLWGIAVRRLIDLLRRRGRTATPALPEPAAAASAEDEALVDLELGPMAVAMRRLSPEFRAVLQATVLDGLTTKEAAVLLGIPVGTVKTRAMRARAQLREALA
jgi:RNA polymerase sigma-70 factor, ECF subfamily